MTRRRRNDEAPATVDAIVTKVDDDGVATEVKVFGMTFHRYSSPGLLRYVTIKRMSGSMLFDIWDHGAHQDWIGPEKNAEVKALIIPLED